jgi:transposase-like protein
MDGSLRFAALRNEFANAHRGLEALPRWRFLSDVGTVTGGFLGFLLRSYRGRRHPLKHVLLMAFLFDDPTEFNAQYENSRSIAEAEGADALSRRLTDKRARLIQMVESEGRSVNAACRELGIQTAQGIRQLNKESIAYRRRPRILTDGVRNALDDLLRAGADRGEISRQLGVRKGFIKDYLAGKPELRAAWEQAVAAERTVRYRAHFLRVLEDNPGVPIKRIRRIRGNGFEWLYRNDRAWLAENLPGIWRRP